MSILSTTTDLGLESSLFQEIELVSSANDFHENWIKGWVVAAKNVMQMLLMLLTCISFGQKPGWLVGIASNIKPSHSLLSLALKSWSDQGLTDYSQIESIAVSAIFALM